MDPSPYAPAMELDAEQHGTDSARASKAETPLRVLLLCDRYPFPLQNGQNLRVWHYVKRLRTLHRFDLLCHGDGDPPPELHSLFDVIEQFPPPPVVRRRGLDHVRYGLSVGRMFPDDPRIRAHLTRILPERDYDVIWMSGWGMVVNLPDMCFPALLADIVDDGVLEYWRELKRSRSVARVLLIAKWLMMNYRFERYYFGPAAQCLFVSEVDAATFKRVCPATPTAVIHNGVDEEHFRPLGLPPEEHTLVFEGRMDFRPNADAAISFCRELLPHVRAAIPDARLKLVGMNPAVDVRALASDAVDVTGHVDDVRPYLDRARLFICPLRKGAGIKNKILQAWAMGKAVVATPESVGGLNVQQDVNIVVRPFGRSLAKAVVDLLNDPARAAAMGAAGRRTIINHYTWDQKALELDRQLRNVAYRARSPRNA